ncbi:MAG: PEP-CTERM sorting domain-containing protein [candidate division KSB1 bacterium]|nr:PEP-CTERM sorting domain-containing protein [candidate division KSB1 bacterium]
MKRQGTGAWIMGAALALTLGLMGAPTVQAVGVVLDDFDTCPGVTANTTNGTTVTSVSSGCTIHGSLGGVREKEVTVISGADPVLGIGAKATINTAPPGVLNASTDSGVNVGDPTMNANGYVLRYDGVADGMRSLGLNKDLTNVSAFTFKLISNDHVVRVYAELCSDLGGTMPAGVCAVDTFTKPPGPQTFAHGLSNFGPTLTAALRADVDLIQFRFLSEDPLQEIDFRLDLLGKTVVPEPATIFLMGAGFVGLGIAGYYRRRRQS